jgi:hypothetical protein
MRLRVAIDGVDFSGSTELASLSITQDSTQAISTAQFRILYQVGGPGFGGKYDEALYDEALYGWTVEEWQEARIWDDHTGATLFGGFILGVQEQPDGPHKWFQLNCSDYGILLDRRIITQNWAAGTADSTVLTQALAQVPELSLGHIETIVSDLGALEMKDQRVRDLFDAVCVLTGGEYNVGFDGAVNYYKSGSIMAPFDLSDDRPDGVGTVGFTLDSYSRDFSDGANHVLVLGAIVNGVEISAVAEDLDSIARYHRLDVPIANRQIIDVTMAQLYAATQVAERSKPKEILRVWLLKPGLERGQTVNVYCLRLGLLAPYIIRTMQIVPIAPDYPKIVLTSLSAHVLRYTATLGFRPPDTVYQLRRMQRWPVESTKLPFSGATASFQIGDGRTVHIRGGIIAEVR